VKQRSASIALGALLCSVFLNAQDGFLTPTRVVHTTHGRVKGFSDDKVDQFLGIPYAAPPVGNLRWQAPVDNAPWSELRDAIQKGSQCIQPNGDGSEDCLYLNIYRPAGAKAGQSLPVILFIHGGGNQQGSGNDFNPTDWVAGSGIVVVTINYRVNLFGFLSLPALDAEAGEPSSGNFGLMDQQAAMRWVKANIHAFGGDELHITLQGESAGGVDICANLISPPAAGLFARAIMESMYCPSETHAAALQAAVPIVTSLGCTDIPSAAVCMRGKSPTDLLAAAGHLSQAGEPGFPAAPNFGNSLLPLQASDALGSGQWNQSDILIGSNRDDASPFVSASLDGKAKFPMTAQEFLALVNSVYRSFAPAVLNEYPLSGYSDPFLDYADQVNDTSALGCPVTPLANLFAAAARTFRYEFDDRSAPVQGGNPTDRTLGAYHGAELVYLFTVTGAPLNTAQQQLSAQMRAYWANFAKAGDPNGAGLTAWPLYDAGTHQVLSLNPAGNTAINNFDDEHHCAFWAAAPGPPFSK
jgi:para-nitrobenzyl esterase